MSKGQGGNVIEVGSYKGKSFQEAIGELMKAGIPFIFSVRKAAKPAQAGTVTDQNPEAEQTLAYGQTVQLTIAAPASVGKDNVFGLFRYTLPDYPIAVDIRIEVVSETGTVTLLSMKHPGGPIAVPYIVPEGSEIVLSVLDQELAREKAADVVF